MKKTPNEWKEEKKTDSALFAGAKVLNRWFDNSLITEEQYLDGLDKFSNLFLG